MSEIKLFKCYAGSAPVSPTYAPTRWSALAFAAGPAAAAKTAYDVYLEQQPAPGYVLMPFRVIEMLVPPNGVGHVAEPVTEGTLVAVSPAGAVAAPAEDPNAE